MLLQTDEVVQTGLISKWDEFCLSASMKYISKLIVTWWEKVGKSDKGAQSSGILVCWYHWLYVTNVALWAFTKNTGTMSINGKIIGSETG